MSLLEYRTDEPLQQGSRKYHGATAAGYDAKRENSAKWQEEDRIIKDMLSDFGANAIIFDCPVGTGRFIPFYEEKGFHVNGMDASEDMLKQAVQKIRRPDLIRLIHGNILDIGAPDKSMNVSLMIRLTRWLSPEECVRALQELQRITRERIIFTARVRNHPHARPYGLIAQALNGWCITRDEGIQGDENYRILQLEPTA